MDKHKSSFIQAAIECDCLRFGDFTLKSGLKSPYFFNAGNFSTGKTLTTYARSYAVEIKKFFESGECGRIDALFGPAYKGIPLVASVATILFVEFGIDVPFVYDRQEVKDHGEGGQLVGVNEGLLKQIPEGQALRILILDDVITAGTAIRGTLAKLSSTTLMGNRTFELAGVLVSFDRCEVLDGKTHTTRELLETELNAPVRAVASLHDVVTYFEKCHTDNSGQLDILKQHAASRCRAQAN